MRMIPGLPSVPSIGAGLSDAGFLKSLFSSGRFGWLHPMIPGQTLFQDVGGTIPAVAPGDPVGLSLDTSGNDNHWYQATALNRPILSRVPLNGRRNLLRMTHDLTLAQWGPYYKRPASELLPQDQSISPYAPTTRFYYDSAVAGTNRSAGIVQENGSPVGGDIVISALVRFPDRLPDVFTLSNSDGSSVVSSARFVDGVEITGTSFTPYLVLGQVHRLEVRYKEVRSSGRIIQLFVRDLADGKPPYSFEVAELQAEYGDAKTPTQIVRSNYDVFEPGAPDLWYLTFNGTNSSMESAEASWASNALTLVGAVTRDRTTSSEIIYELSTNSTTAAGSWCLMTSAGDGAQLRLRSRGTATAEIVYPSPPPGAPFAFIAQAQISPGFLRLKAGDGSNDAQTISQGTGGYGNHALYIGARRGVGSYFAGALYPSIGISRVLTADELTAALRWLKDHAGVST